MVKALERKIAAKMNARLERLTELVFYGHDPANPFTADLAGGPIIDGECAEIFPALPPSPERKE